MKRTKQLSICFTLGAVVLLHTYSTVAQNRNGGASPDLFPADPSAELAADNRPRPARVNEGGILYDNDGVYQGKVDTRGRIYDSEGVYTGRMNANGEIYDSDGVLTGRKDARGNLYDAAGDYQGRVTD